jgi:hypothetical protein
VISLAADSDTQTDGQQLLHARATKAEIDLSRLLPGPRLIETRKPLIDDLFTAFGWPECPHLAVDGKLRADPFRPTYLRGAQRWA